MGAGCHGSHRTIEDGRAGELGENLSCNFPGMRKSGLIMGSDAGRMGQSTQRFWIVDTERTREFLLVVMSCDQSEFEWVPILPAESVPLQDLASGRASLQTEALAGNVVRDCSYRVAAEPDLSFTLADMAWYLSKSVATKCRPPAVARSLGIIGDLGHNATR